jgi:hypothetical protein
MIFWTTLDHKECSLLPLEKQGQAASLDLDQLIVDLEIAVAAVNVKTWLRFAPAIYAWVCFTGAAVAQDMKQRARFHFYQSHQAFIYSDDCQLQDSWSYFRWLREFRIATI